MCWSSARLSFQHCILPAWFFVPLALADLLSFALGPLVALLRRWRFGYAPSVIAAVFLTFTVIFGMGSFIGGQLAELAENIPQYQINIAGKVHSLRASVAEKGLVGRASGMLNALDHEITGPGLPQPTSSVAPPTTTRQGPTPRAPIPVKIHQPEPNALRLVQSILAPLIQPLATTGLIVIFVIFFLLQREYLRDRFIRLAGTLRRRDVGRSFEGLLLAIGRSERLLSHTRRKQNFRSPSAQTATDRCFRHRIRP